MPPVIFRILFVPVLSSMLFLVCVACAQDIDDPMIKVYEDAARSMTGSVDLSGRVVDSEGSPIDDVTIKYLFRELQDVLSTDEIDYKRIKVDGDFRFKKFNISSVHLTFLKEGYYAETWSYGFHPDQRRNNPDGVERIEIEIVLETQPPSAPLKKYQGILRTASNGPISVVEIKRQGSGETWIWKDGQGRELIWPHVFLAAGGGTGMPLPMVEFESEDQRFLKKGLRRGWIEFSDFAEGDGFVVYEQSEHFDWAEIGLRRMTEAPESGYEPSMELSASESPPTVYFYCKVNGKFGKGMVTGRPIIATEEDRQVARAAILVYINPTGSRNVSYVHN
jgi:hypothetical protein